MAEPKTTKNDASVTAFLEAVEPERRRTDAIALDKLFRKVTGHQPKMWGPSIVGYGEYHYVYASGREGDWMLTGFSPRKTALTLYIMAGFTQYDSLMERLGKHKTGKSCLYVNKLDDVDQDVLAELIAASAAHTAEANS